MGSKQRLLPTTFPAPTILGALPFPLLPTIVGTLFPSLPTIVDLVVDLVVDLTMDLVVDLVVDLVKLLKVERNQRRTKTDPTPRMVKKRKRVKVANRILVPSL